MGKHQISKDKYETFFQNHPLSNQILDKDGFLIDINKAWLDLLGYKRREVIGKLFLRFICIEFRDPIKKDFAINIANGNCKNKEMALIHKHGHQVYTLFNGYVETDKDGGINTIHCVFQDITTRIETKLKLKHHLEYQRLISDISSNFMGDFELKGAINQLLQRTGEFTNSCRSYLFRISPDEKLLNNTNEWCAKGVEPYFDNLRDITIDSTPWLMDKLYKKEIIHINDVSELPQEASVEKEILQTYGTKSLIILPLFISDRLIGFIGFDKVTGFISEPKEFYQILKTSSEILTNSIHRVETEKKVKQSEILYRTLYESAGDAIFIIKDGIFTDSNTKTLEMFACRKEEIIGQTPLAFSPLIQDDGSISAGCIDEKIKTVLNGKQQFFTWKHKKLDGTLFDTEITLSPLNLSSGKSLLAIVRDVTNRKIIEKTISENHSNLKAIIENTKDLIWSIDSEYRLIIANSNFQKMIKPLYGRELKKGDLLLDKKIINQDLYQKWKANYDRALSGKEFSQEIISVTTTEEIINENTYNPILNNKGKVDGVNIIARNITEFKKNIREIKKLSTAVDQSSNAIIITDIDGDIEYTNQKFTEISGYSKEEIIGKNPSFLNSGKHNKEFYTELWKTIKSGETWKGEFHNKTKDNILYHEKSSITPLKDDKGNIINYLGIKEDITHRKMLEEHAKLQYLQLEEQNRDLNSFSHTVAHDLKNPLARIISFAHFLLDDFNIIHEDEKIQFLNAIVKGGENAIQIINSLLLFASVRKKNVKTEKLQMSIIIRNTIERLTDLIDEKEATIILPENWPDVLGYPDWVEETWVNYLSNALKYGGSKPQIEFGYSLRKGGIAQENHIRFWIKDSGPGISKQNQNLLFEKFERLEQVNITGHGLGLSIVKSIINKLNGEVGVESKLGNGSTFYFTLPKIKN